MSRVINTDSAGKQRTQMTKAIAVALRELSRQTEFGDAARDLAAFIAAALQVIFDGIDASVSAWEKRGYWVKADRFRMEWAWAGPLSEKLSAAVLANDVAAVAGLAAQIAAKFSTVPVSEKHRLGKPWIGAFRRLAAERRG